MIPLEIIFNIFFVLLLFTFWGLVFVILYHLARFGIGVGPKRLAAVFFFGSMILFAASFFLYANVDIDSILQTL